MQSQNYSNEVWTIGYINNLNDEYIKRANNLFLTNVIQNNIFIPLSFFLLEATFGVKVSVHCPNKKTQHFSRIYFKTQMKPII